MSLFEVEGRVSSVGVANGSKLEIDVYGEVVGSQTREGCAIHMWELNETEPVRHLERSESQRIGGATYEVGVIGDV